jgi:hypothetical protein
VEIDEANCFFRASARPSARRAARGDWRARSPADHRADRAAPGAWQHRDRDDRYAQTPEICDRVMPMQHGEVTFESHAAATSAEELLEIVRREYLAVCAG